MSMLRVMALAAAGPPEALAEGAAWLNRPGAGGLLGGREDIDAALGAHFPPLRLRRLDSYAKAALLAAKLAREAATGHATSPALIVCTGLGPVPATNAFMESFLEFGASGASPTAFSQTVHNMAASTISQFLDLRGAALTVSQPDLGLATALDTAWAWLATGQAGSVLLGAVDDGQPFAGLLSGTGAPSHAPLAVFALLTLADSAPGGLLDVERLAENQGPPRDPGFRDARREAVQGAGWRDAPSVAGGGWTGPAARLARFALASGWPDGAMAVAGSWRGVRAGSQVRARAGEEGK